MNLPENESQCITHLDIEKCSIVWTIKDFSLYDKDIDKKINSSEFSKLANPKTKWYLGLFPFGNNNENSVSLYLYLKTSTQDSTRISYEFSILDKFNKENLIFKNTYTFNKLGVGHGYPEYIPRTELLSRKDLLPNDTLTISCKVCVYIRKTKQTTNDVTDETKGGKQPVFFQFLESKLFSDVNLVVDSKNINAHKMVLSIYSDVFQAMFISDMIEQKSNRVEITDLSFEAVTEMVQYMYCGKVPPYGENTEALLKAADKYNVKSLLCEIEKQIIQRIAIENACDLFIVAHTWNLTRAKEMLKKFIFVENFEELKNAKKIDKLYALI